MKVIILGRADPEAVNFFLEVEQERWVSAPQRETLEDLVIVYEPTEVFSIKSEKDLDFVRKDTAAHFWKYLEKKGVPLIMVNRGGGIIWHGPGQLCLAPVIDARRLRLDIIVYRMLLEDVCIKTLAYFGINGERNFYQPGSQGVWVRDSADNEMKKIAFLGWRDRGGIAIHGCAINVSPDLYPFSFIDPCNLPGVEVTSMERVLGAAPELDEVKKVFGEAFAAAIRKVEENKEDIDVASSKK